MGSDDLEDTSLYKYEVLSKEEANFRQTLLKSIEDIQPIGDIATGGVLDSCPIPGICVDRKPIAIPLSEEAAQDLASKSEKAPFGIHNKTLVDDEVRKTLQISADRISFENPRWTDFFNELVQRVVRELGLPPAGDRNGFRAKLHKHLLYGPGDMFKSHRE
jgi:hypothetical protein